MATIEGAALELRSLEHNRAGLFKRRRDGPNEIAVRQRSFRGSRSSLTNGGLANPFLQVPLSFR